ncbi:hypothetical protein ACPXB3_09415 [Gordonia sp. DT219]|uniref:hypothetical protein n=1 Tax=Gordonia sp. DT219 TaxID=3416658 RepID=UPI003CF6D928
MAVTVVLVVAVGVTTYFSTGHRAARMADRIGVSIPADATRVGVDDPPFALQGNCSMLDFQVPQSSWQSYVSHYFDVDRLRELEEVPGFCGHSLINCHKGIYAGGFEATEEKSGIRRSLQVIPDCVDGQAQIVWGTTD